MAALIVSLSGCANTDYPQAIQDSSGIETVTKGIDERTEPEDRSSASVSESKESSANSTAIVQAETESAQAEESQPAAEQSPALGTQPPQTAVSNNTPKTIEPTGAYSLRRIDPQQTEKDTCTYCNQRKGYDYEIIPKNR